MTEPETPPDEADREIEHAATERLIFFSDAVTAIALTLLALELPVPEGDTSREVFRSAREHFDSYLAFVISFMVIASHWRAHHDVFRFVRAVNPRLTQLNFGWLLLIVITPFTTQVISEGDGNLLRFSTYAVAQAVQSTLFAIMVLRIRRDHLLLADDDQAHLRVPLRRSWLFAVTFAASIPFYLLLGQRAFFVWLAIPLLFDFVRRLRRRPATA